MDDVLTRSLAEYLTSTEELVEEARNGRMFILVDNEDRENEGDLIIPAQFATPDAVNFMVRHARGLVCLAMTRAADRAARPAADEPVQRHPASDRVHGVDRGGDRRRDRHFRPRPRPHRGGGDQPGGDAGGYRDAGSRLPA